MSSTFKKNLNDDCTFFQIIFAKIENNKLQFENFYKSGQCLKNTLGGRIVKFNNKTKNGILVTLGAKPKAIWRKKKIVFMERFYFLMLKQRNLKFFQKGIEILKDYSLTAKISFPQSMDLMAVMK